MEGLDVSLEPTFEAEVLDDRFKSVAAALLAFGGASVTDFPCALLGAAAFEIVPLAFITPAVFAAGFKLLFTVLWVGLAIDFVAVAADLGAAAESDTVPDAVFFRGWAGLAALAAAVRASAAVLPALLTPRLEADLVTVAFMLPSLNEPPDRQLPGLKSSLACSCGISGFIKRYTTCLPSCQTTISIA
ncbi:hypothetical protein [Noviherbaspirillum malthae]|jgi:hypothetical protein|uniref:hypothetical protein n=1 Tax=Noviherbaspirillum malthae TaxID=1260987 RepID=UPI0018908D86|nr:hypothetical protein [Noviherbaspirillum malthae]